MSFLAVNGTIFIQLINFAIFLAILNVVFLRPVAAAIRRRREYINSVVADYDRYQSEAKALRDRAESVRAAARRDAELRVAAARAQASNETAEIAAKYAHDVKATIDLATRTVAGEVDAARAGEERAVEELAHMILERVASEVTS
jgi:F-type H+-transporting ATPase subunit b